MGKAHHGHAGWEFAWLECQGARQRAWGEKVSLNTSAQCLPCAAPWGALHPHFPRSTLYPSLHSWLKGSDAELHLPVSSCDFGFGECKTQPFPGGMLPGHTQWSGRSRTALQPLPWIILPPNGCGKRPALGTGPDGLTLRNRGCHYTSGDTGNSRGTRALRQPPTRKAEAREVLGVSLFPSDCSPHSGSLGPRVKPPVDRGGLHAGFSSSEGPIHRAGQGLQSLGCGLSSPENLQLHGCYCFSQTHATSSKWGQLSILSAPAERKQTNKRAKPYGKTELTKNK